MLKMPTWRLLTVSLSCVVTAPALAADLWQDIAARDIPAQGLRVIEPRVARLLQINPVELEALLAQAPLEFSAAAASPARLSLPMPDGGSAEFLVRETQLMHPDLAARYPQIRTWVGQGLSDPTATARFDFGPRGFHGMILSAGETVYIDPVQRGDRSHYQSYFRKHAPQRAGRADQVLPAQTAATPSVAPNKARFAGTLRSYRLAVAATGDYSHFQDPPAVPLGGLADKAIVLSEMVVAINRVVGIYERDFGIRMQIVAQNDQVIFQHPVADPYVDGSLTGLEGLPMLFTNTPILDLLVGAANYDVGHVFSVGGGGVAQLGAVCGDMKGAGVTGLPEPVGDPFYVDYVAHEIGHQFGANHTFNGINGSCSGGNRNGSTAYEPGSATTIMGYAGICGTDNTQMNSDDHFHGISFDEVTTFISEAGGASCGEVMDVPNQAPLADAGLGGQIIPVRTPFELNGTASDPDGDAITAHWEQFDLGPGAPAGEPVAEGPLFRSYPPTTATHRTFPRIEDLAAGVSTLGEVLPTVSRDMRFRFTVRDNAVGAGGVSSSVRLVRVSDQAGPFRVTAPGGGSVDPAAALTVRWDVANTDAAPIFCGQVNIRLSQDGGLSYPDTLLTATPNDGEQDVTLPSGGVSRGRIRVDCADNVFFAISANDFSTVGSRAGELVSDSRGGAAGWSLLVLWLGFAWRRIGGSRAGFIGQRYSGAHRG